MNAVQISADSVDVLLTPDMRFQVVLPTGALDLDSVRDLHAKLTEAIVAVAVATGRRDL